MTNWHSFWQDYRIIPINNDDDLLFQAGWTVSGKPVAKEMFHETIKEIVSILGLNKDDILLDLCCGNGVVTYELSHYVKEVIAVDFSAPLIFNAQRYKSSSNIHYYVHDINRISDILGSAVNKPNKIVVCGALAYFRKEEIIAILKQLKSVTSDHAQILLWAVYDRDRIWKFFNSFSRKMVYIIKFRLFKIDIGLSQWWRRSEFIQIASSLQLQYNIYDPNPKSYASHYIFNIVFTK